MSERVMVFHPTIAPYRVDFFNELYDRLGARICLYYRNLKSQKFDYEKIERRLHFVPDYFEKSIRIGRRELYIGHIRRMREYRPDTVIAGEYGPGLWCGVLYKRLFDKRCRLITICDDSKEVAAGCRGIRRLSRKAVMKHLDGNILCNKGAAGYYERTFGISTYVFPIIPSDKSYYSDRDEAVRIAKGYIDGYGLEGKRLFLFVGRLSQEKNIEYLISSFVKAHDEHKENVLFIIGSDGGSGYEKGLKEKVRDLQADGYIRFMGRSEDTELRAWMYLGQCLVLPSRVERFGAVVGEALLAGEYVMVSDRAGAAELVDSEGDVRNGEVIDIDRAYIDFSTVSERTGTIGADWEPHESRLREDFEALTDGLLRWIKG